MRINTFHQHSFERPYLCEAVVTSSNVFFRIAYISSFAASINWATKPELYRMQVGPGYPYRASGPSSPTVVVVQSAPPPIICDRYPVRCSIAAGIAFICIGILCAIFNGVLFISAADVMKYLGHGFWSAFLFVTTGSLGIVAGKSKTRGSITGFLVMSIISAICSAPLLAISISGAIYARPYSSCYYYGYYYYSSCANNYDVAVAMESLLAICAVVAGILSILGCVVCCKATCVCCGATPLPTQVMYPANYYPGVGQMMYVSQTPSANYFYAQPNLVASAPRGSVDATNWNQPMSNTGLAFQEPPPFELQPPTYSYTKP